MAFSDPKAVKAYTLAGNAIITLQSQKSEDHFTYRIEAKRVNKERQNFFFVSLLTGPDTYSYMGILKPNGSGYDILGTAKAKVSAGAQSFKAFAYFWKWLDQAEQIAPHLTVRHEGVCGRCGRPLTTPKSIDRGIGPECASKMEL